MDELSQKKFDGIIQKDVNDLTTTDVAFLKARRSYLSPAQEEFYAKILDKKFKIPAAPLVPTATVTAIVTDIDKLPYKELQRRAKTLGLPFIGQKREDLLASIRTAEGVVAEAHPE